MGKWDNYANEHVLINQIIMYIHVYNVMYNWHKSNSTSNARGSLLSTEVIYGSIGLLNRLHYNDHTGVT